MKIIKEITIFRLFIITMVMLLSSCTNTSTPEATKMQTPIKTEKSSQIESPTIPLISKTETIGLRDMITPTLELCANVPVPELSVIESDEDDVYLQGKFSLCYAPEFTAFDLDKGTMENSASSISDIQLEMGHAEIDDQDLYYITEINNSRLDQSNTEFPDYDYCNQRISSQEDGWFFILGTAESAACILTNEGRLAMIHVEQINPYGWGSIEITFITWK